MTRQRIRPSLKRSVYKDCPCCIGTGVVKTAESMAIDRFACCTVAQRERVRVSVAVAEEVANYLQNKNAGKCLWKTKAHDHSGLRQGGSLPEHLVIECVDSSGREIKLPLALDLRPTTKNQLNSKIHLRRMPMYAIVTDGAKQLKVEAGQVIDIDYRPWPPANQSRSTAFWPFGGEGWFRLHRPASLSQARQCRCGSHRPVQGPVGPSKNSAAARIPVAAPATASCIRR